MTYIPGTSYTPPSHLAVDASYAHVYYCDDTSGSNLVDVGSAAVANAALIGTVNVAYRLGSQASPCKRGTRGVRLLGDASSRGAQVGSVAGLASGPFSIECLVNIESYLSAVTTVNGLICIDNGSNTSVLLIAMTSSGTIFAQALNGGTDRNTTVAGTIIGTPLHLALTYSVANGGRIYRNGTQVGTVLTNGTLATMTRITLGNAAGLTSGMRGWLAECRVSTVERTAAEVMTAAETALAL